MTFQIIDAHKTLTPQFISQWRALSERAIVANPFWGPDFCLHAMKLASPESIKLAAVTNDRGSLIALAPFIFQRMMKVGPKVAMLWTHDYIPLGSPLVAPDEAGAFEALLNGILQKTGVPLVGHSVKQLPQLGTLNDQTIKAHIISNHERAAVKTNQTGEVYRQSTLSKQRRQGLDRRFRRLKERTAHLGALEIDLCNEAGTIPARLEGFLALEKNGWKGRNKSALLSNKRHATFARDAVLKLAERKAVMIATLKAGETPLAALILFKVKGQTFSWKTTFDENYKECSPGAQLLARFADPMMGKGEPFLLDSCATPTNDIANAIWGERETVSNVIFAPAAQSTLAKMIKHSENLKEQAKRTAKSILKR